MLRTRQALFLIVLQVAGVAATGRRTVVVLGEVEEAVAMNDYPILSAVPKTTFSCKNKTEGYYADPETGCQVFHLCSRSTGKQSFVCPNGTLFNTLVNTCDWRNQVTCADSFPQDLLNASFDHPNETEQISFQTTPVTTPLPRMHLTTEFERDFILLTRLGDHLLENPHNNNNGNYKGSGTRTLQNYEKDEPTGANVTELENFATTKDYKEELTKLNEYSTSQNQVQHTNYKKKVQIPALEEIETIKKRIVDGSTQNYLVKDISIKPEMTSKLTEILFAPHYIEHHNGEDRYLLQSTNGDMVSDVGEYNKYLMLIKKLSIQKSNTLVPVPDTIRNINQNRRELKNTEVTDKHDSRVFLIKHQNDGKEAIKQHSHLVQPPPGDYKASTNVGTESSREYSSDFHSLNELVNALKSDENFNIVKSHSNGSSQNTPEGFSRESSAESATYKPISKPGLHFVDRGHFITEQPHDIKDFMFRLPSTTKEFLKDNNYIKKEMPSQTATISVSENGHIPTTKLNDTFASETTQNYYEASYNLGNQSNSNINTGDYRYDTSSSLARRNFTADQTVLASTTSFENSHLLWPLFPPPLKFYSTYPRFPISKTSGTIPKEVVAAQPTQASDVDLTDFKNKDYESLENASSGLLDPPLTSSSPIEFATPKVSSSSPQLRESSLDKSDFALSELAFLSPIGVTTQPGIQIYSESTTSSLPGKIKSRLIDSESAIPSDIKSGNLEIPRFSLLGPPSQVLPTSKKHPNLESLVPTVETNVTSLRAESTTSSNNHEPTALQNRTELSIDNILPARVEHVRALHTILEPPDVLDINNLRTQDSATDIVRSISFDLDSEEERKQFELALSKGIF